MLYKITTTIFALIIAVTTVMAQAPAQINYQGVARDASGNAIANQSIKVRFKIRHNASNGTVQYQETRTLTTSASGLFTAQIGGSGGNNIVGSMGAVTWNEGTKFLQVEMDPAGGSSFTNMGTQLLVSVPYALQATKANTAVQADSAAALNANAVVKYSNLETSNASTNQVLTFDGYNWVPYDLTNLMLPLNVSDPNLTTFVINNTSAIGGTAIYGRTTTNSATATGIRGESTGASGNGVYGKAAGATSFGVLGENTTGYGIKGTTAGTNMAGVYGNNSGTQGSGVLGTANAVMGYGVQGSSTIGTGVYGYSNSLNGVFGNTISGTALKGVSSSGYGLDVSGKVKIAGGNTNPGAGKVLTSDASGNATWQAVGTTPKVAFKVTGMANNAPAAATSRIHYATEVFDAGNNYNTSTHEFTAPVNGYYQFSINGRFGIYSLTTNLSDATYYLVKNSNGNISWIGGCENAQTAGTINSSKAYCNASGAVKLLAGDKVYVEIYQNNLQSLATDTQFSGDLNIFSGVLIQAE